LPPRDPFRRHFTDGNIEPERPAPVFDVEETVIDVLGRTFLMDRDDNGDMHRAEVLAAPTI